MAAQPGHTKELQSVQLERGLRIVDSPGVIFDDDDEGIQGQNESSVLLRNVVKPEDVDDPISIGMVAVLSPHLSLPTQSSIKKIKIKSRGDPRAHAGRQADEDIQPAHIQHDPRIPNNARAKHRPSPQSPSPLPHSSHHN